MIDKFSTCEYCKKRGPLMNGGGFMCSFTGTRMLSKYGHCEYHDSIAYTEPSIDEPEDEAQGELF